MSPQPSTWIQSILEEKNGGKIISPITIEDPNIDTFDEQYSYIGFAQMNLSQFCGIHRPVKSIGNLNVASEEILNKMIAGIYFETHSKEVSELFLPLKSISDLPQPSELENTNTCGVNPQCVFCTDPTTYTKVKWPLDPTFTIHKECYPAFFEFITAVFEQESHIATTITL